jgi:NADH-quinone oxidoreductase subunit J
MILNIVSIFYILLIFSSLLMVLATNPIYSVFFLISIFLNTSIIFILFNVDFIGILLLLVYVGAIAILFLFLIMMINLKKVENENHTYLVISFSIFTFFIIYFLYFLISQYFYYFSNHLFFNLNSFNFFELNNLNDEYNNLNIVKKIGRLLFIDYYLFLFFSGLLLLVSLVGSIFLTNYKKGYSTKVQYNQLFRKNNLINCHII